MSYSGPGVGTEFSKRFSIEIEGPKAIPLGQVSANAEELLKLQFTKPVGAIDMGIFHLNLVIMAEMRRTAGAGFTNWFWQSSPDDVAWNLIDGAISNQAAFQRTTADTPSFFALQPDLFFRLALLNDDVATSGEIQHGKFFVDLVIPEGYVMERLI